MKRRLFNMPNKMIISESTSGASADAFYGYAPAPSGTEVTVDAGTLTTPSASLYCILKDHGYYNEVSIVFDMLNGSTPVQKTVVWDYWNSEGSLHSKAVSPCAITEVLNFTATYSGLELPVADLKIQAKDAAGEFITIPGESTTAYNYYPCYFQEVTTKSDLLNFGFAGVIVEDLYYCRVYHEMETLDQFQIEGYTKEVDGATVNQNFQVFSLVRKIRTPGSSKVVAYDFFAKELTGS
ncbi:MAG: hypothetical protein M0Q13_00215 [Methanothrix sp.]|nr:hypothetical protein [Methanothrix sp.]